jgi:hypothetical protein
MLELELKTNNAVIWVTSQFGGPTFKQWVNAKAKDQVS